MSTLRRFRLIETGDGAEMKADPNGAYVLFSDLGMQSEIASACREHGCRFDVAQSMLDRAKERGELSEAERASVVPSAELGRSDLKALAERCRPAVAHDLRLRERDVHSDMYAHHYKATLQAEAERAAKLIDDIDAIINAAPQERSAEASSRADGEASAAKKPGATASTPCQPGEAETPCGAAPSGSPSATLRSEPEHVCGLQGFNPMIDPPCPGCSIRAADSSSKEAKNG